jgi:hypothetical protein
MYSRESGFLMCILSVDYVKTPKAISVPKVTWTPSMKGKRSVRDGRAMKDRRETQILFPGDLGRRFRHYSRHSIELPESGCFGSSTVAPK